jgi:hypothetical protein
MPDDLVATVEPRYIGGSHVSEAKFNAAGILWFLSDRITTMRGSRLLHASTMSGVRSVEPSSTIRSSKSAKSYDTLNGLVAQHHYLPRWARQGFRGNRANA